MIVMLATRTLLQYSSPMGRDMLGVLVFPTLHLAVNLRFLQG